MAEERRKSMSRSNRQRKVVSYKQAIDSDEDDFADSPPTKKHKTEKANSKKNRLSREEKDYNRKIEKALKESQAANSPVDEQTSSKNIQDDDFVLNNTLSSEEDVSEENFSNDSDFCSSPPNKKLTKKVSKKKVTRKTSFSTKNSVQKKSKAPQSTSSSKSTISTLLSSSDPKAVPVSDSTLPLTTANTSNQLPQPNIALSTANTSNDLPQPNIALSTANTSNDLPQPNIALSTANTSNDLPQPKIALSTANTSNDLPQPNIALSTANTSNDLPQPKIALKKIPPKVETQPMSINSQTSQSLLTPKTGPSRSLSVSEPSSTRKFPKWTPPSRANKGSAVNIRPPTSSGSPTIRVGLSRHAKVKPLHRI